MAEIIEKYFPSLTQLQREQFDTMLRLYPEWNAKINVISRKDIENLEINHLLHSLQLQNISHSFPARVCSISAQAEGFRAFRSPQ